MNFWDKIQHYLLPRESSSRSLSTVEKTLQQAEKVDRFYEPEEDTLSLRDKRHCYPSQQDSPTRGHSCAEKILQQAEKDKSYDDEDENQIVQCKSHCYSSQWDSTRRLSTPEKMLQQQAEKEKDRCCEPEDYKQSIQKMHCYPSQWEPPTRRHSSAEKTIQQQAERDSPTRRHSSAEKKSLQPAEKESKKDKLNEPEAETQQCDSPSRKLCAVEKIQEQVEKEKEKVGKLEEENEILRDALKHCTKQLDSTANKLETAEKATEVKENEVMCQKEPLKQEKDQQKPEKQDQKNELKDTPSLPEPPQKSSDAYQDNLKEALEKLYQANLEAVMLRQELQQTQKKKSQLEEETCAYKNRMKKLNGELKKLQDFHQQSEEEVEAFIQQIEDMNYQLAFWQKTHESDLQFLAAKDEQLVIFKVEMASLKENLREEEKRKDFLQDEISILKHRYITTSCEVEALRNSLGHAHKDTWTLQQEREMVASNVHHWVKEQKDNTELLGSTIQEQVKCICQLTDEKDHLHNVMVHLQHENKKLRKEIDHRRQKNEHLMVPQYDITIPCIEYHLMSQCSGEN
ncbi:polyamine-modulated factor 1-binding protein 1 [Antechinus flavipes]|uniref:polyamine-modulated factor 1-binding protein 1 n=1 Tax=Antechinus flavipes TaxID=38775 RepID=UPI002235BA1E|nr:polyamine-modulated factor 1-binding protein 1 [Antechinus flavipes]